MIISANMTKRLKDLRQCGQIITKYLFTWLPIHMLIGMAVLVGCDQSENNLPERDNLANLSNQHSNQSLPVTQSNSITHSKSQAEKLVASQPDAEQQPVSPNKLASETRSVLSEPLPVFRPDDNRPQHDIERLKKFGIARYESRHLLLYTDIEPQIAKTLPPIIDQAYTAWEEYFGKLPPNRSKSAFQITGYLMSDKSLFERVGLLPDDLQDFLHGRHRGAEFWMNEQEYDYYRRHLLIHEATHCFMTIMPNVNASVWYMEGMAELFGTHRIDDLGKIHFRVMPQSPEEVAGLGRISIIQSAVATGNGRLFQAVTNLKANDFLKTEAYAWSWGLCHFFEHHPRYARRFRKLGKYTRDSQFPVKFQEFFKHDLPDILTEWPLFAANLQYGYNCNQSAITFQTGKLIQSFQQDQSITIQANRGWQSSKILIQENHTYQISAEGQFHLKLKPKPWTSEADGISFKYFQGLPLGRLLATVRIENPTSALEEANMLNIQAIGKEKVWHATASGTLYLRLNDSWNELTDNTGSVEVTVREIQGEKGK